MSWREDILEISGKNEGLLMAAESRGCEQVVTATFEFCYKDWLLTLETLQTFDQHNVKTKKQKDNTKKRQKDKNYQKTQRQKLQKDKKDES